MTVANQTQAELRVEAELFGRYLLGCPSAPAAVSRYSQAVLTRGRALGLRDAVLLAFAVRHPWSVGFIDGGLALLEPYSEVRHRLFLMLAILESTPQHHDRFLPTARGPAYLVIVVAVAARAAMRAAFGLCLVKFVLGWRR